MPEKELTQTDLALQIGEAVYTEIEGIQKIEYAQNSEPSCFFMHMADGKTYIVSIAAIN